MPISSRSAKLSSPNVKIQDVPNVPTIGTPTQAGNSVLVNFTPATLGGRAAIYRAVSNPGGIQAISYGSSPVVIESGLASGTAYTFTVRGETSSGATNGYSAASSSISPTFGSYELISTTILSSAASSITFSSIPQTYKHLQIRMSTNNTTTSNAISYPSLRINGDSGGNYSIHSLNGGYPNGIQAEAGTGRSEIQLGRFFDSYSNLGPMFGAAIVDIPDYANTAKNKTVRALGGAVAATNQDAQIRLSSGAWYNTAAINSLTFTHYAYGGNYATGSRISIYGIKG